MGAVGGLVHLLRRDNARAGRMELAQAPERSVRSSRWLVQWRSFGSMVHWTAGGLGPSRTKFSYQGPAIAARGSANQNKAAPGRFPLGTVAIAAIKVRIIAGCSLLRLGTRPSRSQDRSHDMYRSTWGSLVLVVIEAVTQAGRRT